MKSKTEGRCKSYKPDECKYVGGLGNGFPVAEVGKLATEEWSDPPAEFLIGV